MSVSLITFLEDFSSELFVEIFQFLNGYDIYKAFYGLNHRLSEIVLTYGIKYIDLCEIKLHESRKIVSDINCSKINILKVSSKYNDEQVDQIFNNMYISLSNTNHLYSLTLDSIGLFTCYSIFNQYLYLINLKILIIRFQSDLCTEKLCEMYHSILYNACLHFKNIKLLDISTLGTTERSSSGYLDCFNLPSSTEICSSLQYLYIDNVCIQHIENFFKYFPNLYELNAIVKLQTLISDYPVLSKLTICTLKIFSSEFAFIAHLLIQCSNLKKLILDIIPADNDTLDSLLWEELFTTYLLNAKRFQVNMIIRDIPIETIREILLNDIEQEKFWIERKTIFNIIDEQSIDDDHSQVEIMIKFSI